MTLGLFLAFSMPVFAEDEGETAAQEEGQAEESDASPPAEPQPGESPPVGPPPAAPPPHIRPPQPPDHPAPIGPPPPKRPPPIGNPPHHPRFLHRPVRPVGEARLNWDFADLQNPSGDKRGPSFRHGISVPRAELGFEARISDRIQTRMVLHGTEAHDRIDVDPALLSTHEVDQYPRGWAVQAQDVYATIQPFDSDDFWVQPGVQMTIFGSRNLFDEAQGEYYLVGPRTEELAELAGVIHGRDLGVRVHGDLWEDRLAVDAMVANGEGHTGIGEGNLAKDLSLRLDVAATETLHIIASGQRAIDGPQGRLESLAWSVMAEWRTDGVKALAEYVGGSQDLGPVKDPRHFVGGQGGLALERQVSGKRIDRQVLTARVGYFDPIASVMLADAWFTSDLSLQSWWKAHGSMGFMTGLGYNMWMPMDDTQPIAHSLVLQTLFQI